jgi:hypothetical protein
MNEILSAIKELLEKLFRKSTEKATEPKPKPEPVKPTESPKSEVTLEEPEKSTIPVITSFLWKPDSDTFPKGVVVSVSSDTLRARDVRIKFVDKNGKNIKIKTTFNEGGHLRGNRLPNHKFGRFNFKPGGFPKDFENKAPISVSFTAFIDGIEVPCKVMGKDFIVVKDVHSRLELR